MPTEITNRSVGAPQAVPMPNETLTQIQPFNEFRFDDCIAYISAKYGHPLSSYEMIKLHVMIDVYHTLERGKPVIGGPLYPFRNGPVSRIAKGRIGRWKKEYDQTGAFPERFILVENESSVRFQPSVVPDAEDFTKAELDAMDRAWEIVIGTLKRGGWEASQNFFHRDSFIGRAWQKARRCGGNLSWNDILDEYAIENPDLNISRIKGLLNNLSTQPENFGATNPSI